MDAFGRRILLCQVHLYVRPVTLFRWTFPCPHASVIDFSSRRSFIMSSKLISFLAILPAVLARDDGVVRARGLVRYSLTPQQGAAPLFGNHSKRQQETGVVAKRHGTLYIIDLTFGTPGQAVTVAIDTGLSELWTNPVCSKSSNPDFCNSQPRFTQSTTLVDYGVQGSITWSRGTDGAGDVDFEYVGDYVAVECKSQIHVLNCYCAQSDLCF